jgi:metal-dependent hydrolase (beta-lactamase superfamily II)
VKTGIKVLSDASVFMPTEPWTGLALCYNSEHVLINTVASLDQHFSPQGISQNQVASVFLTHLHDDHSSLLPLMVIPHKIDLITTCEIFTWP